MFASVERLPARRRVFLPAAALAAGMVLSILLLKSVPVPRTSAAPGASTPGTSAPYAPSSAR